MISLSLRRTVVKMTLFIYMSATKPTAGVPMIQLLLLSVMIFPAFSAGIIIRNNSKPEVLQANLKRFNVPYQELHALSLKLGIYSVEFADVISAEELKSEEQNLKSLPGTLYTSKVSFVKNRAAEAAFAEDPWSLGSTSKFSSKAIEARNKFGEPATNKLGQEVVVAIVEGGTAAEHTSYNQRLWINKAEIPNNKIDDDKNGIVDDVMGLRANVSDHTTHVAGIMVSKEYGVARTAKLISVNYSYFGLGDTTKNVVRAYEYVMALKRRYFLSGGREGANIVSVNSSFGLDGQDCSAAQYTVWNDVYNEMGKLGILNVVATTNSKLDVDAAKDIPSTCQSPYVIAIGNIDKNGAQRGGYGRVNIDLFSPGTDIMSTIPTNSFGTKTGTSMATPHVTAGVGYLYLIAPLNFSQFAFTSPDRAAYQMKQVILNSTTRNGQYVPMNAEAGHFNLLNASKLLNGLPIDRYNF